MDRQSNIQIQKPHQESFDWFKNEGMPYLFKSFFERISKVLSSNFRTEFVCVEFVKTRQERHCDETQQTYDENFCRQRMLTYCDEVNLRYRIVQGEKSYEQQLNGIFVGGLPRMTSNESFIINGKDVYITMQLLPSPGFFVVKEGNSTLSNDDSLIGSGWEVVVPDESYVCYVRVQSGYAFYFHYRPKKGCKIEERVRVEIRRSGTRKILSLSLQEFLDALGLDLQGVPSTQNAGQENKRRKQQRRRAINKVYEFLLGENNKKLLEELSADGKVNKICTELFTRTVIGRIGRWQVNRRLKRLENFGYSTNDIPNISYNEEDYFKKYLETKLTLEDLKGILKYYLLVLNKAKLPLDDLDHIDNYVVVRVGDLLYRLLEGQINAIFERLSKSFGESRDLSFEDIVSKINKNLIFNLMPIFTRHPARRYLKPNNILEAVAERRRITKRAPGGVRKDSDDFYNPNYRDMHWSYYGRLCPVDTPTNKNIGLLLSLATYAWVDRLGRICAPYRKVENGKVLDSPVVFLTASEEEPFYIAYGDQVDSNGRLKSKKVLARKGPEELVKVKATEVSYIDLYPEQVFSLSANLIPFIRHTEPNRAMMACSAMRQALPLKQLEEPLVKTGWEKIVCSELTRYWVYMQPSMIKNDCLALGKNALVAFMPWFGWNFEDGIVVSDQFAQAMTSVHVYEYVYVLSEAEYRADLEKLHNIVREHIHTAVKIKCLRDIQGDIKTSAQELKKFNLITQMENDLKNILSQQSGSSFPNDAKVLHRIQAKLDRIQTILERAARLLSWLLSEEALKALEEQLKTIKHLAKEISKNRDQAITIWQSLTHGSQSLLANLEKVFKEKERIKPEQTFNILRQNLQRRIQKGCEQGVSPEWLRERLSAWMKSKSYIALLKGLPDPQKIKLQVYLYQNLQNIQNMEVKVNWLNVTIKREYDRRQLDYRLEVSKGMQVKDECPIISIIYGVKESEEKSKSKRKPNRFGLPSEYCIPKLDARLPLGIRGTVTDVSVYSDSKELPDGVRRIFRITIRSEKPLQVGDKLSGRHGNKGVVTRILPSHLMPFFYDEEGRCNSEKCPIKEKHTHVDVLINPLSIPSRQNLGQLYEACLGWVIRKHGNAKGEVFPLSHQVDIKYLSKKLQKVAQNDLECLSKQILYYVQEGKDEPVKIKTPITVGYVYLMKLDHNAEDKLNVRGTGGYSRITAQPLRGRRLRGGQRLGEMEVWALLAHNAHSVIAELLGPHSDDQSGRILIRDEFWVKLEDSFWSKISSPYSLRLFIFFIRALGLDVRFLKNKQDVTKDLLAGNLEKFDQVALRIATESNIQGWGEGIKKAEQLSQEDAFKTSSGVNMHYIDLNNTPVLNPLFEPLIRSIVRFLTKQPQKILEDIVPPREIYRFNQETVKEIFDNPDKMRAFVNNIQLSKLIEQLESNSHWAWLAQQVKGFQKAYQTETLKPLLIRYLPALPPQYRPRYKTRDGKVIEAYLSEAYQEIFENANKTSRWKYLVRAVDRLFNGVYKRRWGYVMRQKGLLELWEGKMGLARHVMLGKRCDYSARAVIIVDPELGLDECSLPQHMVEVLLNPVFQRWVVKQSISRHTKLNGFLQKELNRHLVLLNRNPTLHRMGIMAFKPSLHRLPGYENVICINPLVTVPFGADFDGDQMAVFVPMTKSSQEEMRKRMMPSHHIFSPANGDPIVSLHQDIALGIYLLSLSNSGEDQKKLRELFGDGVQKPIRLSDLCNLVVKKTGSGQLAQFLNNLKKVAFEKLTQHGCTYSLFDLSPKILHLSDKSDLPDEFKDNSAAWIFHSGARGNKRQMKMMVGEIKEIERIRGRKKKNFKSNLMNGLSLGEYYYLAYESRKTQVDKQLITPKAGWTMRKLIFATQHLYTVCDDCSKDGKVQYLILPKEFVKQRRGKDLIGRWCKIDGKEELLTEQRIEELLEKDWQFIEVRSPLYCRAEQGVCQHCYGWDLSKREPVEIGEPVGLIASQSIGERLTQLSLATVHRGRGSPVEEFLAILERPCIEKAQKEKATASSEADKNIVKLLQRLCELMPEVNAKHFEVVLRALKEAQKVQRTAPLGEPEGDDEKALEETGDALSHAIQVRGWLSRLAFGQPRRALRSASLSNESDMLRDPIGRLLVALYRFHELKTPGVISHAERQTKSRIGKKG
jgi:DNA-directed RNA polymerase beta subunit/DNA-directed RNA polymerase beta' subunit